jgi:hypothetical protein
MFIGSSQVKKKKIGNIFQKEWSYELFGDINWQQRIQMIEDLHSISDSFPTIHHTIDLANKKLIQTSSYVWKVKGVYSQNILASKFDLFCEHVSMMHEKGYIHGDILVKNIIFNGTDYVLVDHEPSLSIKIADKLTLIATKPWIAIEDFLENKISQKTDLLCLEATRYKLFDKPFYHKFRALQLNKLVLHIRDN